MKQFISSLVTALAIFLANVSSAQDTEIIIEDVDNYHVIVKRTWGAPTEIISPEPNKVEFVEGSLEQFSSTTIRYRVRLKKDGPIDLSPYGQIGQIGYHYAEFVTPTTASFDHTLFEGFHIASVLTDVTFDSNSLGGFVANGDLEYDLWDETADYIEIQVNGNFEPPCVDCTQFQSTHFLASAPVLDDTGITLPIWKDGQFAGSATVAVEGNKGTAGVNISGDFLAFITGNWTITGGHYTSYSVLANGGNPTVGGLDLTGFNTLNITLACPLGLNVEVFFGRVPYDSSQSLLPGIICDDFIRTYSFDISAANKSNMQNLVWVHIPTWINTGWNNISLYTNITEVTISE